MAFDFNTAEWQEACWLNSKMVAVIQMLFDLADGGLGHADYGALILDAGVDIRKVQDLLGHRHVTTTQIYDKRRRSTAESASHDVPI
jgi:hypothetical protein